jgi:hypothetical protein
VEFIPYFLPAALACWWGVYAGRKASALALLVCLLLTAASSVWIRGLVAESGLAGWQFHSDNRWAAIVGMIPVFCALSRIGPIATMNKRVAVSISATITLLFVVTFIPMLFVGCTLFAICI